MEARNTNIFLFSAAQTFSRIEIKNDKNRFLSAMNIFFIDSGQFLEYSLV
jgi:hypothetical protein